MQFMGIWINRDTVVVAVGVVIALWFFYTKRKAQERLKKLAWEMGLTFSTSANPLVRTAPEQSMPGTGSSPSGLAAVVGLFGRWRLTGEVNGVKVDVHQFVTRVQDKPNKSTRLKAFFDKPKSFGMFITHRRQPTFSDKIVAKLIEDPRTEIQTGNESLDQKVTIKAKDVDAIRSFACDAGVQDQITRAFEFDAGVSIDDEGASVIRGGSFSDPDQIRAILNALSETVRRLETTS